jgi:transcriptional regulator with XRE-family HTH domain
MSVMRHNRDEILMTVLREFGSAAELAKFLNVSKQAISNWEKIPVQHIRALSEKMGINPHHLRPDYYIETYWSLGKDTNEISYLTQIPESDVYRILVSVLESKRLKVDDQDRAAVSP